MTTDQTIDHIINSFDHYNLGDIKNARKNDINIGCFILCGCFIDQLAHFRYYKVIRGEKDKFGKFVNEYLPAGYIGRNLYDSFRSTLMHNYSIGKEYALAWGNKSLHLNTYVDKILYLDLDQFIEDIENAYLRYKTELRSSNPIRAIAIKHYFDYPTLTQLK